MSSRVAPTRYLEPGRLDRAARTCPARGLARRGGRARRVDWCSPSRWRCLRAAGRRSRRAPAPDLGVRERRLARLGQLLVRGPLRAHQLQPALLPARGAGRLPHGRGRRRSSPGRGCSRRPCCASGGRPPVSRLCSSPRSGPACWSRGSTRSRSAARSRSPRSSRCSATAPCCSCSCCLASLLASPLAFLLLGGHARRADRGAAAGACVLRRTRVIGPVCAIALLGLAQLLVFRAFPAGGCVRVSLARPRRDHRLRAVRGGARARRLRAHARSSASSSPTSCSAGPRSCIRRRSAGTPPGCSTTSRCRCSRSSAALRSFRPRLLVALALGVAVAWQSVPIVKNAVGGYTDQAQAATFWMPALDFLRPIAAARAELPRRGGRDVGALGGVLPAEERDPARRRLVPPERLPAAGSAGLSRRPGDAGALPRLAARDGRALRAAAPRRARSGRARRGHAAAPGRARASSCARPRRRISRSTSCAMRRRSSRRRRVRRRARARARASSG